MNIKSVTATILQATGLITALTGCIKSIIDLISAASPRAPLLIKSTARFGGPHPPPPPPPPEVVSYVFMIGPVLIVAGLIFWLIAKRMKKVV